LDGQRCRPEYVEATFEDLRWLGIEWEEGPDCGGKFGPYRQSQRHSNYRIAFDALRASGKIYPCYCSRKDIASASQAPHAADDEPIYTGRCRPVAGNIPDFPAERTSMAAWRFRVPEDRVVEFADGNFGPQRFLAGRDFGDFVVWTKEDWPSYQLACVCDDAAMAITEVVRGADLLLSTARQLLLFEALGWVPPEFYHCSLVTDPNGRRLAKRDDSLSLRTLRKLGTPPETIRSSTKQDRQ
jgi:glutamyl-tRNA synthetase